MASALKLLAAALAILSPSIGATCPTVRAGENLKVNISPRRPACFLLQVNVTAPIQLLALQSTDLSWTAEGSHSIASDGFDFGDETLTLTQSGLWMIKLSSLGRERVGEQTAVQVRSLSPREAALWRQGEEMSTLGKKTMHASDITAALTFWMETGNSSNIGRTQIQLGDNHLNKGESSLARASYEQAWAQCNKVLDIRCRAEAANNGGLAAKKLGDAQAAKHRFEDAVKDWGALRSTFVEKGMTLSNLGLLLWQTGDIQQSISSYDKSRQLLKRRDPVAYAIVLNNLGLCYLSLGDYGKARGYLNEALRLFTAHGEKAETIRSQINLGRAEMLSGASSRAARVLSACVKEAVTLPDRSTVADALNNLGQTQVREEKLAAAGASLSRALAIYRDLKDRRGEASALYYLGAVSKKQHKLGEAKEYTEKSARLRNEALLLDDEARSLLQLAELEQETGNAPQARDSAERALAIVERVRGTIPGPELRASYYSTERRLFDLLVDIALHEGHADTAEKALLIVERGRARALLDSIAEGTLSATVPQELVDRRRQIRRTLNLLSFSLANSARENPAARQQVQLLLAEEHEVNASYLSSLRDRAVYPPFSSLDPLCRTLPDNTAILEFHLGSKGSHAWIIRRSGVRHYPLAATGQIARAAQRFASLFSNVDARKRSPALETQFASARDRLSRLLLGMFVEIPPRLIIVPDTQLAEIAFSALRLPGTDVYLGLATELLQVPSAAYLVGGPLLRRPAEFSRSVLAIVDPVYSSDDPRVPIHRTGAAKSIVGSSLSRLPFTMELGPISKLVPASRRQILSGFDASRSALDKLHPSSFGVLHFSTHAVIDGETPELSRVALSLVDRQGRPVDGYLRAYDFAGMRLEGSLVVLSACETALGRPVPGEGVVGVASSLFRAGAGQLVVTLTRVDAEAASEFFRSMYTTLFASNPMTTERAMMLARRELSRSDRWADPSYWASFILTGRPTR